jgi:regulation of enolase protein 1 (concanavalin A-like superfamily)
MAMGTHTEGTERALGQEGWRWLNRPARWSGSSDALEVTTDRDTDFWVRTHYGFVRDTGHALLRPVPAAFRMRVTFDGGYRDQYDQAGLLLRLDANNWIKTGIEYVDGHQQLSAVVTREVSDWSVVPLGAVAEGPAPVTVDMRRAGDTVTVSYGIGADAPETLLRLAFFPEGTAAQAGPMCASPDGGGFTTRFTEFRFDAGQEHG